MGLIGWGVCSGWWGRHGGEDGGRFVGDDKYECTRVVCGLMWFSKEENDDPTGSIPSM